jgi:hypothetical protein
MVIVLGVAALSMLLGGTGCDRRAADAPALATGGHDGGTGGAGGSTPDCSGDPTTDAEVLRAVSLAGLERAEKESAPI